MPQPDWQRDGVTLYRGDCVTIMAAMPQASIDTIITDPPYGLAFMGKVWDRMAVKTERAFSKPGIGTRPAAWPRILSGGCSCSATGNNKRKRKNAMSTNAQSAVEERQYQHPIEAWHARWAREALRVAKPGAFLLAFGGTRTFHRLTCALEDAGWEIRDCLMWLYGSGFPKSHNISKALDKAGHAERPSVGTSSGPNHSRYKGERYTTKRDTRFGTVQDQPALTAPATADAKCWDGWGTALKPAWEPIIVAMKPCEGPYHLNARKHGVAGLNIDGARVGYADQDRLLKGGTYCGNRRSGVGTSIFGTGGKTVAYGPLPRAGRWPANVLLSHHAACRKTGEKKIKSTGHYPTKRGRGGISTAGHTGQQGLTEKRTAGEIVERWICHPGCPIKLLDEQSGPRKAGGTLTGREPSHPFRNCYGEMTGRRTWVSYADSGGASRFFYCAKASRAERNAGLSENKPNDHPTVKPRALIEYLCRLTATPTGGVILDPFAGSGTTLCAAARVGRECIGIEIDPAYVAITKARLLYALRGLKGGARQTGVK